MRKRRKRNAIVVPVASMGDIAFLLIIFFMLCSNFAKESGINIRKPTAVSLEQLKESKLSISIDDHGAIHLNGAPLDSVRSVEDGVRILLEGRTTDEEKMVMFKCDRDVDKKVFEPVLDAIAKAGGIVGAVGEPRNR